MNHRLANLDLLRGLAALAVCAGHLRAFLFVDFGQVTTPSYLDRFFYLVTGLGHQAVGRAQHGPTQERHRDDDSLRWGDRSSLPLI